MRVAPSYFREQAIRLRRFAKSTKDKDTRDELIRVACEYDRLAEEAERTQK